ncbi:hypothetical protein A4G20_09045 [Pasteurellaceae bacterium RH1A]|nr:hypothetical protein A4G20_09045 [Pasteurellaceae bacterium RH1A]
MHYPSSEKYNEAVQVPNVFTDLELRNGHLETNKMGMPRVIAGGFALTYSIRYQNKKYAVRCFHRKADKLEQRYQAITRKLKSLNSPYFLDFQFQRQGIKVDGNYFPIVKMEWAKGETLGQFVSQNYRNRQALANLSFALKKLAHFLENNQIAHGDIQPGNIMVADQGRQVQLIDYDGMYIPELQALGSSETGVPNFQHPGRNAQVWDNRLDRFSFILLDLVLNLLMHDPSLWDKTQSDGDAFLFRAEDYKRPNQSALFRQLLAVPAFEQNIYHFMAICQNSYQAIPNLKDFLASENIPSPQRARYVFKPNYQNKQAINKPIQAPQYHQKNEINRTTLNQPRNNQINSNSNSSKSNKDYAYFFVLLGVFIAICFYISPNNSSDNKDTKQTNTSYKENKKEELTYSRQNNHYDNPKKNTNTTTQTYKQSIQTEKPEQKPTTYVNPKGYKFYDGLAKFEEKGQYGFIDQKGNVVIPAQFKHVGSFSEGYVGVVDFHTNKWGFIDKNGQYLSYGYGCVGQFKEGLAAVNLTGSYNGKSCIGGKWGFINKKNDLVIDYQFDNVETFKNGKAKVSLSEQDAKFSFYINTKGQPLSKEKMEASAGKNKITSYEYREGMAKTQLNGYWGYINTNGEVSIPFQFKYAANFYDGLAAVQTFDNLWGYINYNGQYVIPPQFGCVWRFSEGLAAVNVGGYHNGKSCSGGQWGFINQYNQWVINPVLEHAEMFKSGKAKVKYQGRIRYINKNGYFID